MAMVKKTNLKKTGGRKSTALIQSPTVKRIHSRPVTLQGWLQKRGSDGLMLWKKRWFVLSDYCLFYYKDQEEDILLGSFVLASWIISPCTHKDKVYKKYSFKAEHNNMRTYYFAADNDVIMAQWLKALTMASLLQESPRPTTKINNSQINQIRHKEHNLHKQHQQEIARGYNYGYHSGRAAMNADNQPLYVNAPPKPKRLNDGSTPDPNEEESKMLMYQEGTSTSYYKSVNPSMVPGSYFPPGANRSLIANNVLPRNHVITTEAQPPITTASHYECLRTSYTVNQIAKGSPQPPRPRSVDFLDYEIKNSHNSKAGGDPKLITLPRRPKSSMSISTPKDEPMDSATHWSEESYAKKMRESSMYVRPENENSTSSIRTGSSQQERDVISPSHENVDNISASSQFRRRDVGRDCDNDPNFFKRSASARLPEPSKDINDSYGSNHDPLNSSLGLSDPKKAQQREVSMKRLLEWKERMQQSPLSQKHPPNVNNINEMGNHAMGVVRSQNVKQPTTSFQFDSVPQYDVLKRSQDLLEMSRRSVRNDSEYPIESGPALQTYNAYQLQEHAGMRLARGELDVVMNDINGNDRLIGQTRSESEHGKPLFDGTPLEYPRVEPNAHYCANQHGDTNLSYYMEGPEQGYGGISKGSIVPNGFPAPRDGPQPRTPSSSKTVKDLSVNEADEEWGLKLDESSVIKEFSYHYIKNDSGEGCSQRPKSATLPSNAHVNARQQYRLHGTSSSPSTVNPHHPSYGSKENPAFMNAEGQPSPSRNKTLPVSILKNMKSKKKLDLDFTSDATNRRGEWNQCPSEVHDKRQVFSDTEALLYETSSEADDREKAPANAKFTNISSDDDRDDEVAAVLAKGHKHSRAAMPEPSSVKTPIAHSSSSTNTLNRESVTLRHSSLSCENITELPEENYMPMTPRKKTIPASPFKDNYEPQTTSHLSNPETESLQGIDECPYVEMTQSNNNKIGSLSGPLEAMNLPYLNSESNYSSPKSKVVESKRNPYDSAYNDISGQEPLYMEVSVVQNRNLENTSQLLSGKKDSPNCEDDDVGENTAVSSALPDILNTTAPTLLHHGSRRSDSSDADDEASKDLDSIDAPRHPRFSLSDTFRPASYYLGSSLSERAIIALNSDHPDSSDSDLVSPPPIPACSPPLDDLDTSIDSTIINKELSLNNSKEDFLQCAGTDIRYGSASKNSMKLSNIHNETGSSEEESLKSERTRHFMKRRPLSADILNSLSDFNILDVPSPRDSASESFDKPSSKALFHNERSFSNPTSSPIPEGPSNDYNPYRKNGFNKNKLFYDWNQPSTPEKFSHDSGNNEKVLGTAIVSLPVDLKYDSESNNKMYNVPPSECNVVGYDLSSTTSTMCPDISSPYANANAIVMAQHESQNAAPYYYSDLFKVDSRNSLNRINKPDDQILFDKNVPVRPYAEELRGREDLSRQNSVMMYPEKAKFPLGMPNDCGPHHAMMETQHTYIPDEIRLENHRRSRSLEGLLDPKGRGMNELPPAHLPPRGCMTLKKNPPPVPVPYNTQLQLQDNRQLPKRTHWEDSSAKVNVRHSRSLEDLDMKADNVPVDTFGHIQSEVVYVNSDFSRKGHEMSEQRVSAEKEREKIRQWDLMSSAPSTLGGGADVVYKDNQAVPAKSNQLPIGITPENQPQAPAPTEIQQKNWDLKFSAGDLLGRTHEELVLLLIQLRRQRAAVCKSMERCHREIEAHACLTDFDSINRLEHVQRLDELKSRLIELEKQYEKGKPLVNLVDNMVKLGSLYQSGPQSVPSEKLEFNHKVQEQRILADERRDWERIRADHQDLQSKVEQLYRLDKLLQEESGTLHNLQEDKGVLERALGGLKSKLQGIHGNTAETEWYRRQQRLLERELSRVRSILALNSKKLEETVAENARLEQELVVLRQKLQLSRRTTEPGGAATAALESELCRVQMLVGNLLRQRQELSSQVRQLTEKSNSLSQQIWPSLPDNIGHTLAKKKHSNSGWIETDLDMGGLSSPANDDSCAASRDINLSPLYVNTSSSDKHNAYYAEHSGFPDDCIDELSPLNARSPDPYRSDFEDDATKRACGSNWRDKPQEIKTVRIVKRESERRQRDRDHRSGNIGIPISGTSKRPIPEEVLDPINEKQYQDPIAEDSPVLAEPSEPPPTPGPRSDSVHAVWNLVRKNKLKGNILSGSQMENFDPPDFNVESPQLSPVYLSEAARKIVEEVAWQGRGEKRVIPRERRRHHTVSGLSISAPKHLYAQKGSRDDLDMERVLRPRLTTPDVVKSTLNRSDTSFTKETIDNILGAPGKIVIPERYIPESQPQLSKEEIMKRSKKADAIRRMLCETASAVTPKEGEVKEKTYNVKHQVEEEKRNREHLLQLSQILAQEVMEKSKIVAIQALASIPAHSPIEEESDSDSLSPTSSLPLYQQRENFYS